MIANRHQSSFAIFAALVLFLATSVFADIQKPNKYELPAAQDSVFQSPWTIDPAPRETDAGRWVLPLREVMQRTYDISGQKSEWLLGTSILGNPELDPYAMGISQLTRRYPSKLAGLYTTRLGYDGSTLTLNGENGILFEERKGVAVDTPVVDVNWERPAFSGNALRLEFRRLVTDSVTLDLGVSSHSTINSKEFSYVNVAHSPYFALGRDSTQIPFGGRNIAMNSMHIQPMLTWRFGFGKAYAKMNYMDLRNADEPNHKVIIDSLDPSIRRFQTNYYVIDMKTRTYGAGAEFYPIKNLTLSTDISYGNHEIKEDSLPKFTKSVNNFIDTNGIARSDTSYTDTKSKVNHETILGSFGVSYKTLLNPMLKFDYEFLNTEVNKENIGKRKYFQDREVGYLQLSDTLFGALMFRVQAGGQRNSSLLNKVDIEPAMSVDAFVLLPRNFNLSTSWRHDNKFPDVGQLKIHETGRLAIPNENLDFEKRNRGTMNLNWQKRDVFYGLGFRFENVEDLIKPNWVKMGRQWLYNGFVDAETTIDDAFKWQNIDNVKSIDWMFQVGFRLGNWKFYLERGETLERSKKLIDTPELYYKGSIHWQNRFVFDRLGVSVRVDWQWFGDRYDCTINNGFVELEKMEHYLALDFEARMQILQFELYSRIENFNHSIYMPESGYTPEGLRFAYGIVWTFGN